MVDRTGINGADAGVDSFIMSSRSPEGKTSKAIPTVSRVNKNALFKTCPCFLFFDLNLSSRWSEATEGSPKVSTS